MATDEYALVAERRAAKRPWRNKRRLAVLVGIVYLKNFIGSVGVADGVQSPGVKGAPFPFQVMLAFDVSLKADEVDGFSRFPIHERIGHVVSTQGVGNLDPQFILHQLHDHCFVVNRVSTVAVRIQPFDLAFRTVARSPEKEKGMTPAVRVLDGGQAAYASDVGIGVLIQVDDFFVAGTNPVLPPEYRSSFGKHE